MIHHPETSGRDHRGYQTKPILSAGFPTVLLRMEREGNTTEPHFGLRIVIKSSTKREQQLQRVKSVPEIS